MKVLLMVLLVLVSGCIEYVEPEPERRECCNVSNPGHTVYYCAERNLSFCANQWGKVSSEG